jgi:hypothetical protein
MQLLIFCHPTRTNIDYKPYNKTKRETNEWEHEKTLNDKVIEYNPKTMPNDDDHDNDKDDIKSKKSESISINPGGAFRELQRIAEIATDMKAEQVPSDIISTLEHSILELGKELGLNRFESLTELGAALTKQNGLGVHYTYTEIFSSKLSIRDF